MDAMTIMALKENVEGAFDRTCESHDPIVIPRENKEAVVILSLSDYNSLAETAYLLSNPKNAKKLLAAINE